MDPIVPEFPSNELNLEYRMLGGVERRVELTKVFTVNLSMGRRPSQLMITSRTDLLHESIFIIIDEYSVPSRWTDPL